MREIRFTVLQSLILGSAIIMKYYQGANLNYVILVLTSTSLIAFCGLLNLFLTRSLTLSVLNIFAIYLFFLIFNVPPDPSLIFLYIGGMFFGLILWYIIYRTIPEKIDPGRYKKSKPDFRLLGFGLILALIDYAITHSLYVLVGSVMDSIAVSWIRKFYLVPIASLSWISLPYLLSQEPSLRGKGVCVGRIEKVLRRQRTVPPSSFTYRYEWLDGEGDFCIDFSKTKNYNVVVLGSSGTGKSTLVKELVRSSGVPFIIFDLHGEYSSLNSRVVDLSKTGINPLSLFGTSPRNRALEVALTLKSIFNLGPLQMMDFFGLLLEAYQEKGIYEEDQRTWDAMPPSFRDVISLLYKKKKLSIRNDEISRLEGLEIYLKFLESNIFTGGEISMDILTGETVILDFSSLPSNEIKYMIMITLLSGIVHNMYRQKSSTLRRIVVLEEAPFLVSREAGERITERLFAEGRKFGYGTILVSQTKEGVDKAINNSDLIFIFKMQDPKELEYLTKTLGGSQPEAFRIIYDTLVKLDRGEMITRDASIDELLMVRLN